MNQLTLPDRTAGYGAFYSQDQEWEPTVKTSAILLPPQPSPPVSTVPHDKYEQLRRYMGARIAAGFKTQYILHLADEYAGKLIGRDTVAQLDQVATLVELAAMELRLCAGGCFVPPL
jgi:hypothetical protein